MTVGEVCAILRTRGDAEVSAEQPRDRIGLAPWLHVRHPGVLAGQFLVRDHLTTDYDIIVRSN